MRIGALLAGQADFIRQVQAYDEKQVEAQALQIYAPSTRGVNNSVVFRPDNPLVADVRVRQALLHATNAKEIVATLFSANYPQATSIIATTALGYVDISSKLAFDLEQGKAAARRGRLDARRQRPARRRTAQELVLTAYESPAAAAEQGDAAARGPAMGARWASS